MMEGAIMARNNAKPRVSLLIQIALIFLLTMLLSISIYMVAGNRFMLEKAAMQGMEVAKVAAKSTGIALEPVSDLEGMTSQQITDTRNHLRMLCKQLELKYLYLYSVQAPDKVTYYVAAAADDEEDAALQKDFSYGKIRRREMHDYEKAILIDGEMESYGYIDNAYGKVCTYVFPVYSDDMKEIVGIFGVDYDIKWVKAGMARDRQLMLMVIMVLFLIELFLSLIFVWRFVFRPIQKLSLRMSNFITDRNSRGHTKERHFSDEITDIEASFDKMAEDIEAYVSDLEKLTLDKAQTQAQLDIARKIQCGIIPLRFNVLGDKCQINGYELPAREVGGDFYDIFYLDNVNICTVVGDISGKGVSAALFMVMAKTAIKRSMKNTTSIAEALESVNKELCSSNPQNMFATVFAAVLNTETGVLRYANAGHDSPLILGEKPYYLNPDSGMALGMFDDSEMVDEQITLHDGEGIFIYTDGVTESIDKNRVQYGTERLLEIAGESRIDNDGRYDSGVLVKKVVDSLKEYTAGLEQFDDITCVSLIYRDNGNSRMTLAPEIASFDKVKATMLNSLGDSDETRNKILACEEIFTNIVNYSGADDIRYVCRRRDDTYAVEFIDNGTPFNPVKAIIRDKDFLELDTGGMGIKLARMNSKDMIYSRENERNSLTLLFGV